jgi:DNA-binding MurR/RpiR family transcriptional regulator
MVDILGNELETRLLLLPADFTERIKKRLSEFTPRQRGLAEFILQNPESIAFLSITDLAKKAGVSQATITRFCNTLGYDGYMHVSKEIQQSIQCELGTVGRFDLALSLKDQSLRGRTTSLFERLVAGEIDNLINLTQSIKTHDFYRCVDMMTEADRICVIGCMASSCLAFFFGYMLGKIFPRVDTVNGHGAVASAACNNLNQNSLVFLISFPRYPRATVELGHLALQKRAKIIAITNSPISPVVPLAMLSFFVPVGIVSFVDAYAAPMVLINALTAELSERNPERTHQALKEFDEYALQANIFFKSGTRGEAQENRLPSKEEIK